MGDRAERSSSHQTRPPRSEEHTSELQSQSNLVCRLLLEKKKNIRTALETFCPPYTVICGSHPCTHPVRRLASASYTPSITPLTADPVPARSLSRRIRSK